MIERWRSEINYLREAETYKRNDKSKALLMIMHFSMLLDAASKVSYSVG